MLLEGGRLGCPCSAVVGICLPLARALQKVAARRLEGHARFKYSAVMASSAQSARMKGRIKVHTRGFGFLLLDPPAVPASAFVAPPDLNPLLSEDEVEADLKLGADGRATAVNLTLVRRRRTTLLGQVVSHGGGLHLRTDKVVANTDWPLDAGGLTLKHGDMVMAAVEGNRTVAQRKVDPALDLALERLLVRHGVSTVFGAAALEDVASALATGHPVGARRDLRNVPTVTVDAPSTRDIDDAIGVLPADDRGGLRLLVSIADASEWVPEGSALDVEARARATSVYLAGRVVPMLPDALSAESASLHPNVDRLCLTAEMRVDPEGNITAVDVYESVIRSWARLNYSEVATWLDHGEVSEAMAPIKAALPWFRAANARLAVMRARRGGMDISRDEARVGVDPATQEATVLDAERQNGAHALIERFMVAANEAVGRWLFERGVPALYRAHDAPGGDAAKDLEAFAHNFGFEAGFGGRITALGLAALQAQIRGAACEPAVRSVLLRALGAARYTGEPVPHFGLSAPLYLHFTSPLRRYADLHVHRTVKQYLRGERNFLGRAGQLEELAGHINERNRAASHAEMDRARGLMARYMSKRVGEVFQGRVTRIKPFGVVVQLDQTLVDGLIPLEALPGGTWMPDARLTSVTGPGRSLNIGMAVSVRVMGADVDLGRVEFGLADIPL
jgi:ribonuclease R